MSLSQDVLTACRFPAWVHGGLHAVQCRLQIPLSDWSKLAFKAYLFKGWFDRISADMQYQGAQQRVEGDAAEFWGKHKPANYLTHDVSIVIKSAASWTVRRHLKLSPGQIGSLLAISFDNDLVRQHVITALDKLFPVEICMACQRVDKLGSGIFWSK